MDEKTNPDFQLWRPCVDCRYWQGDHVSEEALCSKKKGKTTRLSTCEKWEYKPTNNPPGLRPTLK